MTAAYPTGGFLGAYIQTPGTGGEAKAAGDASDGIFVYGDAAASATIGECYTVTGTAGEYNGLTQLTNPTLAPAADCEDVTATDLAELPATDAAKEAYEGMLVLPQGTYTITNNYALNQYGQIGLAFGDDPLFQATDAVRPGAEATAYEAANQLKEITLDDGSSWNYMTNATAKNSPLPYLSAASPMRTGSPVTFAEPVILDYRFQWNYQPTSQVVGAEQTFLTTVNDRPAAPAEVAGDVKLASFNVLNYFDDLGAGESRCRFYADRNGNPVGANNCQVRGAYSAEAFADQEAKIVAAINKLDADVVGLQEIENSAAITYLKGQPRDKALATLVAALNEAGGNWAFAPSPTVTPPGEDVIRTAFIYNPDTIELVGPSYILLDNAFSNARQPLAQEFGVIGTDVTFVAINNHFKSKGSGVDDGTGQGNANPSREAQARALSNWANTFEAFAEKAVFLMGDFNAYTMETPLQILEAAGFENQTRGGVTEEATYQFSGRLGSLDHVFANEAAQAIVGGATVWNINGDESIAFQYSRRNYNVTDFHADDVYASSDHDPVILGILAAQPDTTAPLVEIADQSATVGTEFTLAVEATDDSLPLTYQLGEGAPAWLSIDEDGVLSGMPAEEGTVEVSVVVTDAAGNATTATFSLVVAPEPDTTGPVIEPIADRSTQVGVPFRQQVSATDESTPLIYSLTGAPSWMSIDPTGLILGTPTTVGAFTVTVNVTDSEGNVSSGTFTVIVGPAPTTEPTEEPTVEPTDDPTGEPTDEPTDDPTDEPTDDPTGEPTDEPAKYQRTAPYTLAGLHRNLNGRDWNTTCEQYSQTERCRTEIWATVVVIENGRFVRKNTWTFNNLTYLPYMTREAWGTNPLARTGEWTAETDGRQWRTECDTARTGGNGCRSYSYVTVYKATPARNGGYVFSQANEWVFNNIVMFGSPELR
ncbi:ExeM/NucH family extracellular endonuclease [Tessaracoccus massiliensis]|uniref:ExeM/NucH family extracellular endonuclease n=1 Tax=Tessaracoccus massiliensis TaxID=1522311 RepID=UPI000942DCC0|nr:ExeM/NucH family extracellular endonuclease [Tessaracoccus massiliensis]